MLPTASSRAPVAHTYLSGRTDEAYPLEPTPEREPIRHSSETEVTLEGILDFVKKCLHVAPETLASHGGN